MISVAHKISSKILYLNSFTRIELLLSSQTRLQECLKERAEILQALELAERNRKHEHERSIKARLSWNQRKKELEEELRRTKGQLKDTKKKQEVHRFLTACIIQRWKHYKNIILK